MSWASRPSVAPGTYPRGDQMETLIDQVETLTGPGWTSYASTLAWTSTGVAPALGNATVVAVYRRATESDLVIVEFGITFGGTSTYGTGSYRFSLPVTAATSALSRTTGAAYLLDSGTTERPGAVRFISATTVSVSSPSGEVAQTVPWTWATNDQIRGTIAYEPA